MRFKKIELPGFACIFRLNSSRILMASSLNTSRFSAQLIQFLNALDNMKND